MSEFLGIDIKILDYGGFQFYQTGLVKQFLEDTGMYHCNGFPIPTKYESPLGTYKNDTEAKRDWPSS